MHVFEHLRNLRSFERQHLHFLRTIEDHNLIREIGYHQQIGSPLTLKQLFLLDLGSIATLQRRLRRLKQAGAVQQRRSALDRRAVELTLSPACLKAFDRYGAMLARKPAREVSDVPNGKAISERRHVCTLYEGEEGIVKLAVAFLAEGLQRGEKCILVAAEGRVRDAIRSGLETRAQGSPARAPGERPVVIDYGETVDAHLEALKRIFAEAKDARQPVRLVGDVARGRDRGIGFDELMRYERRLESLGRQSRFTGLCLYDVRRFSSGEALRALKCHRDTVRVPLLLA